MNCIFSTTSAQLEKPGRTTIDEQRNFLTELSREFHTICEEAIEGRYKHEFWKNIGNEDRIYKNVVIKHTEFAKTLRREGAMWKIVDEDEGSNDNEAYTRSQAIRAITNGYGALEYRHAQELSGISNPDLVRDIFVDYSSPWKDIARDHIKDVWNTIKIFLKVVLQYLDEDLCDNILQYWLNPIMELRLGAANDKLVELLKVHQKYPLTINPDFMEIRTKLQRKRAKESIKNINLVVEDAFDDMQAYYQVAMKVFMDNVPTLAIQACFVQNIPEIICPNTVSRMPARIVTMIVGEFEEKVRNWADKKLMKEASMGSVRLFTSHIKPEMTKF